MSVYTSVSDAQMRDFLLQYDLGDFVSLQGIAQGITNSNYFLTTSTGRYVLTVFEVLCLYFSRQTVFSFVRVALALLRTVSRSDVPAGV